MKEFKTNFSYRMGLDLGTSSIGVAIYSLDKDGKISKLEHLDSYIFGEPIKPKEMVTSNTDRRAARLIRRQMERKAARFRKIAYIAKTLGVTQKDLYAIRNQDVHKLRADALSTPLTLAQLVKVLCHLVKNRGYKGGIKDGTVDKKLKQTESMLCEGKTLGELLYERKLTSKGAPWRKVEEDGTFIYRKEVEKEFELIWQEQVKHIPQLSGKYTVTYADMFPDFPNQKEISIKDAFHSALFYQRPIKWELESVGSCGIYPEEKRACTSQTAYQSYRLAKDIADLRLLNYSTGEISPLTQEQKNFIFDYVVTSFKDYDKTSLVLPFKKIYEKLGLPKEEKFTIDRRAGAKGGLKGNTTLYAFYVAGVLGEWETLNEKTQELVLEFLNNISDFGDIEESEEGYIKQALPRLTKNIQSSGDEQKQAAEFILTLKEKGVFSDESFKLENDRASYGITALKTLAGEIRSGREEFEIIAEIKPLETKLKDKMRSVEKIKNQESINDPVISKALNEFHRVMQYVLSRYGMPNEIVVELSREIKNSLKRRKFLEDQNSIASKERQKAISVLQENLIHISPRNIEKYLLWEEQKHICPYSGKEISLAQAFDEKQMQIDHIIPQNWQGGSGGPNVFENKVLVFTDENKAKSNCLPYEWKFKKDITEYLSWREENKSKRKKGEEVEKFGSHSSLINFVQHLWGLYAKEQRGYYSQRERKYKPTQKGARILRKINNVLILPEQIKSDFSNRQNQETAWIGKIVLDWCKDICPKVTPSYGGLTAYLREALHFDRVLPVIRIAEGKSLFDKDNKEIDFSKWQELFDKKLASYKECEALKSDFEAYLKQQAEPCNTEEDKEKMFRAFCAEQRVLLKFDKRCDHRHHAVDAAVIGLCDLSMIKRASDHNAKHGTLHIIKYFDGNGTRIREKDIPGFQVENIPQYDSLKESVKAYLTNYVVWHKPDHYPSGKFFEETAYNIKEVEGVKRYFKRKELKDILGEEKDTDKLINIVDEILACDGVKKEIISQLRQGKLDNFIFRGNKINKVKVFFKRKGFYKFNPNADKSIGGFKYYMNNPQGGYACMDFDKDSGKLVGGIPLWKYNSKEPVKENVVRFFIDDMVFDRETKSFYVVSNFQVVNGWMGIVPASEAVKKAKSVRNIKNIILCKSRQDIAKIKKEYGK
ncbi:MAG: type II CRISPR RNA-guided endonuclease Cas9 [Elusimicrobiaceae bacterium]